MLQWTVRTVVKLLFIYYNYPTVRYDTRCYFNVRSKADVSQLNLPHVKYEAKVLSRVSGGEWGVVDFGKLFAEISEQKFSRKMQNVNVRRFAVIQDANSIWSIVKVIHAGVKVSRKEG